MRRLFLGGKPSECKLAAILSHMFMVSYLDPFADSYCYAKAVILPVKQFQNQLESLGQSFGGSKTWKVVEVNSKSL
jgi:hypothetical protein